VGKMKLLVVQANSAGEAASLIEGHSGVDAVFLPENWLSRRPVPLTDYARASLRLASLAGATVFAGAQYVSLPKGPASLGLVVHPEREVLVICEKIHPSSSVGERGRLVPGALYSPLGLGSLTVGCIVCVDLFYPELARVLALEGSNLLYTPASIPADRVSLWHSILVARAAENAMFVLGVNKAGTPYPDGRITGGGSALATPEGGLEVVLGDRPGAAIVEVDPAGWVDAESRRRFREDLRTHYSGIYEGLRGGLSSPRPLHVDGEY